MFLVMAHLLLSFQLVEENDNEGSDDFEDLLDAADDIGTIEVHNELVAVEIHTEKVTECEETKQDAD
jgi:hypothetical protein